MVILGEGDNLLYNNIFYNENKRGGILLISPNNKVYNNTFVLPRYAIQFYGGGTRAGNIVKNNIIFSESTTFFSWGTTCGPQTVDYNLYYTNESTQWRYDGTTYPVFADYQAASGEVHGINADPKFESVSDAHVESDSPAISAGTKLNIIFDDLAGNDRPSADRYKEGRPTIGAYEYAANCVFTRSKKSNAAYTINRVSSKYTRRLTTRFM